ncbi:MAG: sodium:proton antiporter [Alphaproteobacteria bacterium]
MDATHALETANLIWGLDAKLLAIIIVSIAYLIIFTEKVNRAIVALLGAAVMIISGILTQKQALAGVDFNTLALLIGMMIIVAITEKSGLFQFVAIWGVKKVKASPRGLLMVLAVVTAVFSGFLDNVTTVLLIVPVTFQITKKLGINPYPYLLIEIFASNIGGTATLIGDPPNILIGSALDLTFMDFVKVLSPIVAITMVVLIIIFDLVWKKRLVTDLKKRAMVMRMDEKESITDKSLLYKSLFVLACVITSFIFAKELYLDNGTIALTGAAVLLLFYTFDIKGHECEDKVEEIFGMVDWTTIFFFVGLFVIVYGLEVTGVLSILGQKFIELTGGSINKMVYLILWSSAILSSAIDNIPFVATMIPMIKSMEASVGGREAMMPVWWALSLGACFGGNGTLVGASANVVVAGMASRNGQHIHFMKFLLWSIPVMLLSVLIATVFLYFEFM